MKETCNYKIQKCNVRESVSPKCFGWKWNRVQLRPKTTFIQTLKYENT